MSIYNELYPFQKNIVDEYKSRKSFGIFLDMGLGKTPISLALAEANECGKIIVITINSKAIETEATRGSWFDWASKSDCKYILHDKHSQKFTDKPEMLLVNYEYLLNRKTKFLRQNIIDFLDSCLGHKVAIIVDESHKLKNLQSQQTKAISRIKSMLRFRATDIYTYLLTGTPFTTGYIDLYSQLKMLDVSLTKQQFVDEFCVKGNIPGLLGWQQPIIGYKNINELYDLIHSVAITIKSDIVVDLPEKVFINHTLPCSEDFRVFTTERLSGSELKKAYKQHKIEDIPDFKSSLKYNNPFFRDISFPSSSWIAETNGTFWLRARQLSIGFQGNSEESEWYDRRRLESLRDLLSDYEDNYVLFYNFTPELIELYQICEELGYNIDVYCGEVKSMVFYEKYTNQSEEEKLVNHKNVIIANFASGSTGMNWQEYNKCILFSLPLYKDYEQGIKRIHRIGQKNTVIYHIFYQENWLDKGMKKSLEESINYSEKMFESELSKN